jgi:hypothetical protein
MVMKVIISVIDGIFDDKDPRIKERKHKSKNPYISLTQLISVYFSFIRMYIMSCKEEFSEEDLNEFEVKEC